MTSKSDYQDAASLMRGNVAGMSWPAVNMGSGAALAALCSVLEKTQWMSGDEIRRRQFEQLDQLVKHAVQHSDHFKERVSESGLRVAEVATEQGLRRLRPLARRDIQSAGERLYCTHVPQQHQPVGDTKTSGSTGEPVKLRRTAVSMLFWMADNIRDHLWHRRDFKGRFTAIRSQVENYGIHNEWGPPVSLLFESGPFQAIPISASIEQQWRWLAEFEPDYLLIHPSNLDGMVKYCREGDRKLPSLKQIRTIGEMLQAHTRAAATEWFGVKIADCYSSQEVGTIGIECPGSGLYHLCAEHLIVEVVDEAGKPCGEGETGRVLLTDFTNFATPLVRYEIGDYAEVGPPCPCGRGMPTLRRIVGRERNLVVMPDGTRHWPIIGTINFRDVAPVQQFQFVQMDRENIEARLVVSASLNAETESKITEMIHKVLKHPFNLKYVYYPDRIPRSAGGKFEEFVCRV
jgi:phenylacetate-CoA ligase